MNRENIQKWVDALESGRYDQGQGLLCSVRPDGVKKYCCLGVACEVALADGLEGLQRYETQTYIGYGSTSGRVSSRYSESVLPPAVAAWLGLSVNPTLPVGDRLRTMAYEDEDLTACTTANDSGAWDFHDIADAIREQYLS